MWNLSKAIPVNPLVRRPCACADSLYSNTTNALETRVVFVTSVVKTENAHLYDVSADTEVRKS